MENTTKERPLLYSGPMVIATLEDRKTNTRRTRGLDAINEHPDEFSHATVRDDGLTWDFWHIPPYSGTAHVIKCPYGKPGDRLWVRETWQSVHFSLDYESGYCDDWYESEKILKEPNKFYTTVYRAEWEKEFRPGYEESVEDRGFPWRSGFYMPRWASRITLEITGIRVERLQDISEKDAKAEGLSWVSPTYFIPGNPESTSPDPKYSFYVLWESINSKKHPWASNPWVWVIEFKRLNTT